MEEVTLAEVLKQHGFNTAGVVANAWVADYLGFSQGFDTFETYDYKVADKINTAAYAKLRTRAFTASPFFLYLHYMDPHGPYKPPREHDKFSGTTADRRYPDEVMALINKYDGEIHYVDAKLRELIRFLKDVQLYENTLIIITSDHGESLGEHDYYFEHGWFAYEAGLRADPRDVFPGVNALTMYVVAGDEVARRRLQPIVEFSVEVMQPEGPDEAYWAAATKLELACLGEQGSQLERLARTAVALAPQRWMTSP